MLSQAIQEALCSSRFTRVHKLAIHQEDVHAEDVGRLGISTRTGADASSALHLLEQVPGRSLERLARLFRHSICIVRRLFDSSVRPTISVQVGIFWWMASLCTAVKARGTRPPGSAWRKHISVDESHALQRAYEIAFPDRILRRAHVKSTVYFKWLAIDDEAPGIQTVERALIWLYNPPLE